MRQMFHLRFPAIIILLLFATGIFAQTTTSPQTKNQPGTEEDLTPVIIKHLPDWERVQNQAVYIKDPDALQKAVGSRPVSDLISFTGGTEAVAANYDAGKLLIVEYGTPQFSIDADAAVKQRLTENPPSPPIFFRRIGNYEVFVFDGTDEAAANALIDQVKYEKSVQWLGQDPFLYRRAERAYLEKTANVFVSTIISILLGLGCAALLGISAGLVIFYIRRQKRASMETFSDAGGMIRLNLDELTPDILPKRLLKD